MEAVTGNSTSRVLVLDTDPDACRRIERYLITEFAVSLRRPDEDSWLVDSAAPELVIAVVNSAGAGSRTLIERVRQHKALATVPLLLVTAGVEPEGRALLLEQGASDCLQIPFAPSELLNRAGTLIRLRQCEHRIIRLAEQFEQQSDERTAQLWASENRFRLMVDSIDDYAMFMMDPDGMITSWNRGAERLTGFSESEALGRHFSMFYPRDDLDRAHAQFELAMARKHSRYKEEGLRTRKDGSVYHAQIIVWRLDDERGNILGYAKITRDVTARRLAEKAIRESEAKFKTIADAMPQMVWSTLPDGYHDYFNQRWYQFTGVPSGSTDGEDWNDLFHPADRALARARWQESLATGKTYEIEYRVRHHSGEYRWTLGRALPVRNDDGEIVRWMGTCTDIHRQKQAEEALQEANRRKDDFLAMLAHELRNPLAPVYNSALLIRRMTADDTRLAGALDVIERQVHHMSRLIDDLLDVARISRGKIELRHERFELTELLRQTVEDFRSGFEQDGVELVVVMDDVHLWMEGDRTRIAQIVGNLLHNACKFTPNGGAVHLSITVDRQPTGTFAVINVADSGVGIEPRLVEHLFAPFTQANQGLARSEGGLGLGLALVKGFSELHGGSASARSDGYGKGAVFTLRLPLIEADATRDMADRPEVVNPESRSIVIIEDNPDTAETLSALLTMEGHRVKTAADGDSGVDLVLELKPDLVICDIGLPGGKDGYAVARTLRDTPSLKGLCLVALSGYGQDQDRKKARDSGFDRHLLKPVAFTQLQEVIAGIA